MRLLTDPVSSGSSGLTVGTSTITSGAITRILYDNAGVLDEYTISGTGTVVAMQTAPTFITSIEAPLHLGGTATTSTLTLKPTSASGITGADIIFQRGNSAEVFRLASGSAHVTTLTAGTLIDGFQGLKMTATMPTTISAFSRAIDLSITSAGSSSQTNTAMYVLYSAGYTGSAKAIGIIAENLVAGTGNNLQLGASGGTNPTGNSGVNAYAYATTTGLNIGGGYEAVNGNLNIGVLSKSNVAKNSATNIGVSGFALNTGTSPTQVAGYFGLQNATPIFASAALMCDNGTQTSDIFVARDNGTAQFTIADGGLVSKYKAVITAGWGIPAIYGNGRSTAQTAAVASVATYTCGAADGSFRVSVNVLVTTSSAENFTVTCAYTDESNTARTQTMPFVLLAGTVVGAITFAQGAVPYEGPSIHIRCKASTVITIATSGTFTGCVYNCEGSIIQIA